MSQVDPPKDVAEALVLADLHLQRLRAHGTPIGPGAATLEMLAAEVRRLNEELGRFAETNAQLAKELYEATHRPTRELLEVLMARGKAASFQPATDGEARLVNGAEDMAAAATRLLGSLPDELLDYRTVEGT